MESYIVINGKKAPLTEEQLKMLGLTTEKKNPFARGSNGDTYYTINSFGSLDSIMETETRYDKNVYDVANYCTDYNLLKQRALHETLNRLLWRYSMEHDGDKIDWNNANEWKYCITFNNDYNKFVPDCFRSLNNGGVHFHTEEIVKNAIKEIVKPFMAEHPDFVW